VISCPRSDEIFYIFYESDLFMCVHIVQCEYSRNLVSLHPFLEKFRENDGFTKENTRVDSTKFFPKMGERKCFVFPRCVSET